MVKTFLLIRVSDNILGFLIEFNSHLGLLLTRLKSMLNLLYKNKLLIYLFTNLFIAFKRSENAY